MQARTQPRPAVGIIFDSDMGTSIDDVLALALLHGFDGKKKPEARVVSLSVTKSNLNVAAFCDAVSHFYIEAAGGGRYARYLKRSLPIGLADDGRMSEDSPMLRAALSKDIYAHSVRTLTDTADVAPLIRNALTAQHDQNAIVVLTGPATNLAKVLDLRGTKELIASKVRFLAIAAGAYPEGAPETHIKSDIQAAKKVFAEWPTPIVASGYEVGEPLRFPAAAIEKDFAWAPHHPIVDAYRAHKPMPYDAPTWAMSAMLYAVRPQEGYFKLSDAGTISVLDDGRTRFTPSTEGKHRYLILDPAQKDRILQTYTEVASAKPEPPELPAFLRKLQMEEEEMEKQKRLQEAQPPQTKSQ